jgi:DNA gyrase/topoisomerase IV subunit A
MSENINNSITNFLDTEYKEFALYVVENRSIPSYIDGFKPTQRKVIEVVRRKWTDVANAKPVKVVSLTGDLMSMLSYHHGDSSANETIIGMAQNSIPLLERVGQFGSLRDCEAGQPRYISVKPSKWFDILYKDLNLCEAQFDDDVKIEPKYFLPIIPTVLLNGTSGIAVGFATDILNRNPLDVAQSVLDYLNGLEIKNSKPFWTEYSGEVQVLENNKYIFHGRWEKIAENKIEITELPPSMTYIKFEKILNDLIEDKKILDYDNLSKGGIKYVIKFKKEILADFINTNAINKLFKLEERRSENLTCLDENKKIINFKDSVELIKKFVDFRFKFYDQRKSLQIKNIENVIDKESEKFRFINCVLDKKIIIEKQSKNDILNKMLEFDFKHSEALLKMPLTVFTSDELNLISNKLTQLSADLEAIKKNSIKKMYQQDLIELIKQLKKYKIYG